MAANTPDLPIIFEGTHSFTNYTCKSFPDTVARDGVEHEVSLLPVPPSHALGQANINGCQEKRENDTLEIANSDIRNCGKSSSYKTHRLSVLAPYAGDQWSSFDMR